MATDIKLDEGSQSDWISIEAAVVRSKASDLMIDAPSRRSGGGGRFRRALVHGEDDSLIVNFANDYPGGTRINDALINLKLEERAGGEPDLPRTAAAGTLKLVQTTVSGPVPGTDFTDSRPGPVRLYICVGSSELTKEALWSEVQLGESVAGTR